MIEFSVDMRANSAKVAAFTQWGEYVCVNIEDSNTIFESIKDVSDVAHFVKSDRWTY